MTAPMRPAPHSTASTVPTPVTLATMSRASANAGMSQVQTGMDVLLRRIDRSAESSTVVIAIATRSCQMAGCSARELPLILILHTWAWSGWWGEACIPLESAAPRSNLSPLHRRGVQHAHLHEALACFRTRRRTDRLSCRVGPDECQYGKITAVKPVTVENTQAQIGGALVGGVIGLASGRGKSGSNKALRTVAGGVAGQQVGKLASSKQAFEYTILMGGKSTITVVTDEAGMRVGDCVAVEQGPYVNLRLAADAQCAPRAKPSATATRDASACTAAKDEVSKSKDEESFNLAERKMRLLCAD